jgi:nicotinate phosphoribosyltransferase
MTALLTDLYELTMAAGYVSAGKAQEKATFELFVRSLPPERNYLIAAGLQQAVDYLLSLRFRDEEIAYLRNLPQFARAPEEFFTALSGLHFTGDLWAVPEGTPVFANEPLLTVRAPLIEAQIVETYLLATIGFQTMVASKAARVVQAAGGRSVVEFGTRRAHTPEAGTLAARAAYIAGCIGTSNTEAGYRFGIPVYGTSAHSWVLAFPSEIESFRVLQNLLGPSTIYLIDSYDTLEGARRAVSLGQPLWGVRLDSGDLKTLVPAVRQILDDAGMHDARIMVTGDLNEYRILEFTALGLPIDALGVGTELATSADRPNLGAVYKLVELESGGEKLFTAKFSEDKQTYPGAKQVFRFPDHDLIGCSWECPTCPAAAAGDSGDVEALLKPVLLRGGLVEDPPDVHRARKRAAELLGKLPAACLSLYDTHNPYPVEYSAELLGLYERTRSKTM